MPVSQPLRLNQSQAQHLQHLWLMPLLEIRKQKIKKQRANLSYSDVLKNPPCAGFLLINPTRL
jgi:hypothetical protein